MLLSHHNSIRMLRAHDYPKRCLMEGALLWQKISAFLHIQMPCSSINVVQIQRLFVHIQEFRLKTALEEEMVHLLLYLLT